MKATIKTYYESKPKAVNQVYRRYLKFTQEVNKETNDKKYYYLSSYEEYLITYEDIQFNTTIERLWHKPTFWTDDEKQQIADYYLARQAEKAE